MERPFWQVDAMLDQVFSALRFALSMALPFALFLGVWAMIAQARWGYLAETYAARRRAMPARRIHMQKLVLIGRRPTCQTYSGITTIGATEEGLWLSLMPGFSFFHEPLFIPWQDLHVEPRKWVFYDALELSARNAPDVKMIVYPEALEWIEQAQFLRPEVSPG